VCRTERCRSTAGLKVPISVMPETRSGAGASGSGDPAQATKAKNSPESPTLAIVLKQIRTLSSELAELRHDVARVETREDVLK
jgi:hypothetical protein